MIQNRLSRSKLLSVMLCTLSLGGCANSLPIFSELMPDSGPITTGSIFAPAVTLSTELNASDWEKANQALETALRPENTHEPVQWENKKTAATSAGSFVSPSACRSGASDWKISYVKRLVGQG